MSHAASDLHEELRHLCSETDAPTAPPTPAPTEHHCDAGTHYCWKHSEGFLTAKCTATAGDDYDCECPPGYAVKVAHLSHAASDLHEELRHSCVEADVPTAPPTPAPTEHHCDADTHWCWADAGGFTSAKCTATTGDAYTCECPPGMAETTAHFDHATALKFEVLRHKCDAPTPPPPTV